MSDPITVPQNQQAEEATLGAILTNDNLYTTIAIFLKPEDFFFLRTAWVYRAMGNLAERNEPIDYLTLLQELHNLGKLEEIGGPAYITHLLNNTPVSTHGTVYAHLVEKAAIRRRLIQKADEIRGIALNDQVTADQALTQADELLSSIQPVTRTNSITLHDAVRAQLDVIDQAMDGNRTITGIPTGIKTLDDLIGGFRKARTYFVGARTHMGKTSFMLSTALNAAKTGARVVWISLEEVKEDVTNRLIAIETGLNKDRIATGNLDASDYELVMEGSSRLSTLQFTIESASQMTTRQFYRVLKGYIHQDGVDLVIADYMQLFTSGDTRLDSNEYQRLNRVSSNFATTARDLNIPIMIGVQNNRDSEMNSAKPTLRSFKGTGNIEQDADVALLLYRAGFYKAVDEPDLAEIIVAKNKVNGNLGVSLAYSDADSFRFSDWSARHLATRTRIVNFPARQEREAE